MTDPHAKRRLADGKNAFRKMALTPGAREEFVDWLLENGLTQALAASDCRADRVTQEELDTLLLGVRS